MRHLLHRNDDVRVASQGRQRALQGDVAIHQVASIPWPADASTTQELRFASAFHLAEQAIAAKVFPGAALAVIHGSELLCARALGRQRYEADSPAVTVETPWDLASLTKPLAGVLMAMRLFERGRLSLEQPLVELLPEFASSTDPRRRQVTLAMLLAHSSGLPAHRKLYLQNAGREAMLRAVLSVPLEHAPGTHTEYSDLGFILLGEAMEGLAGESIDHFCQREFYTPLGLSLRFASPGERVTGAPPTVEDRLWRHRVIAGEVNDENASAMGGIAAHAGLFGDVVSVARLGWLLLSKGHGFLRPETIALFTQRRNEPSGTSRTLGWDTPSAPSQSGTHFSARAFGHLGYTGTSLWCDPASGVVMALLTNRTWPTSDNQAIKQVRPRIHDAVMEALGIR